MVNVTNCVNVSVNVSVVYKLLDARRIRDSCNGYILSENYKDNLFRFLVFSDKNAYLAYALKCGNYFELIESESVRAYFDLDYKENVSTNVFESDVKIITDYLNNVFKINSECLIFVREDQNVKSAHIYYNFFTTKDILKKITAHLKISIRCIDTSIYSKNRNFCLPNNTKRTYINRKFIEYSKWKLADSLTVFSPKDYICDSRFYDNVNVDVLQPQTFFGDIVTNCENETESKCKYETEKLGDEVEFNLENLIHFLPTEFYFNTFHFKLLVKYIIDNHDFIKPFLMYSKSVIKKSYTDSETENYIQSIKNTKLNPCGVINLIRKYYEINFFSYKTLEKFITFAIKKINCDPEIIKSKINDAIKTVKKEIIIDKCIIKLKSLIILNPTESRFYYFECEKSETKCETKCEAPTQSVYKCEAPTQKVYIDDILNEDILNKRLLAIRALYGSGKTKRIVFYILEKLFASFPKCKVAFLTETNSLNTSITQKLRLHFPDLTVVSHQDTNSKCKSANKCKSNATTNATTNASIFVCSLESISKCNVSYDYLILDEYESLMFHFKSTTMSKTNNENVKFIKLCELMKQSKKCILLDADLSVCRMCIAEDIIGVPATVYNCLDNNFNNYNYNLYFKREEMLNKFYKSIKLGKKLVFCSNSKTELERIYEERMDKNSRYKCESEKISEKMSECKCVTAFLCSNLTVKIHNSITDSEIEIPKIDFISNLDDNLQLYEIDILLFSPTITTGVSIETNYFDILFASGCKKSAPARIFVQMFFRTRNLNDKEVNICFLHTPFNKQLLNVLQLERDISYQQLIYDSKLNLINGKKCGNENVNGNSEFRNVNGNSEFRNGNSEFRNNFQDLNKNPFYERMTILNTIEEETSIFNFTQYVYSLLRSHNLKVNLIYSDESSEYSTGLYKYIIDSKNISALMCSELIDVHSKEYLENNKSGGYSTEDWNKIQRHNLTYFYPNELIQDSIITNWNGNNENIKILMEAKDRFNNKYNYTLKKYIEIDIPFTKNCLTQTDEKLLIKKIKTYIFNLIGLKEENDFNLKIHLDDFKLLIKSLNEEQIKCLNEMYNILMKDKNILYPFQLDSECNLNLFKDILNKLNIKMTSHLLVYEYAEDPRNDLKPTMLRIKSYKSNEEQYKIYKKPSEIIYFSIINNLYFKMPTQSYECIRTYHSNWILTKRNDDLFKVTERESDYTVEALINGIHSTETFKKSKKMSLFKTAKHPIKTKKTEYYPKIYKNQVLTKNSVATFTKKTEELLITEVPNVPETFKKKRYKIEPIGVYEKSGETVFHTSNKIEPINENVNVNVIESSGMVSNGNSDEFREKRNLPFLDEIISPDTLMRFYKINPTEDYNPFKSYNVDSDSNKSIPSIPQSIKNRMNVITTNYIPDVPDMTHDE